MKSSWKEGHQRCLREEREGGHNILILNIFDIDI